MAYRLNGTTDFVEFAIAPLSGFAFVPFTLAFLTKRGATGAVQGIDSYPNSALSVTAKTYCRFSNTEVAQMLPGPNSGPTLSSTTLWYLVVVTCSAGGANLRFHVHDGTSWTHSNGTAWSGAAIGGTDRHIVGMAGNVLPYSGDIVCVGVKKTDSSDATVQTLSRTLFSAWQAFGFDWLVGFDTSLQTAGVLQDQASPGTGDQIAISGTTVVADPPGWTWAPAAPQPRPVRINTTLGWVDIADQSAFVSGTGAPTAAVGATGAIYLDTASGRMYGPKAAGAWPSTSFGRLLIPGNTYADVAASYTDYARLLAG